MSMDVDAIFKAYDIRGRTDTGELDATLYERVGSALVGLLDAPEIAVGYDCRVTSREFFEAMARGITRSGADVIDLGEVPTDAVYFYSGAHEVPGAVITASHNPPEYNGLKLCRSGAAPIGSESGLAEIQDAVMAGDARRIGELLMLGLRLRQGMSCDQLHKLLPEDDHRWQPIENLIELGMLERHDQNLRLSHEGLFVADEVISTLL